MTIKGCFTTSVFYFYKSKLFYAVKNISILVPESSFMQAIADPQFLFSSLNQFFISHGKKPLFNVQLVGAKKEVKLNDGMFKVHIDKLLKEVKKQT